MKLRNEALASLVGYDSYCIEQGYQHDWEEIGTIKNSLTGKIYTKYLCSECGDTSVK